MRPITLSDLKAESYNPVTLIERTVGINPEALEEESQRLKELISDLESLDEALFFKAEKTKRKLETYDTSKYMQMIKQMGESFERLRIPPLGESRDLLEKNKEILELKRIQKYIRYWMEIERNPGPVLDALLNGDVRENWVFFAELLFYSIKYTRSGEHKEIFFTYSRKLEEKMVRIFQSSLKAGDLAGCKAAFNTLLQLDKETLLLDEFIFASGLFDDPIEVKPFSTAKIDLDRTKIDHNTFNEFIDRITEIIESQLSSFYFIFGNVQKYNDYLYRKLFRTMVFRGLERFLNTADPILFLVSIKAAHQRLADLCRAIRLRYAQFESEVYMNEGFAQYYPKALQKEREFFDEIFDTLVYGGGSSTIKFFLLKNKLIKEDNPVTVYKQILCIVELMDERRRLFYTEEEERELLKYFYRKLLLLLEKTVVNSSSQLSAIKDLSFIYLLTQKYFGKRIEQLGTFIDRLNTHIQGCFNKQVEQALAPICKSISSLRFNKREQCSQMLDALRKAVSEGECLGGRNSLVYTDRMLLGVYNRLYRQIFAIVYSEEQGSIMEKCVSDFLGYVSLSNRTDMVRKFSHLHELSRLIVLEPLSFGELYEEYRGSISTKELKDILSCRRDREEVRKLLKHDGI